MGLISPANLVVNLARTCHQRFSRMFVAFRMTPEIALLRSTHLRDSPTLPPEETGPLLKDILQLFTFYAQHCGNYFWR